MSRVVLVEAAPWSAADGAPVAVRLAGGGTRAYTHRGFNDWRAGVVGIPRFNAQLGFGQDGWTGGAIPTTGAITFAPSDPALLTSLASRMWAGAPIEIRTGDDSLAEPVWTLELKGVVAGAVVRGGVLSVTVSDLSGDLAKPAIEARFAGTGGIEGIAEAKDRIKRRSWGRCWGIEGRLLDKANNIYEFGDPAFPLQAFDAVKDRGRAGATTLVPWAGSVAATFNALKAATAPQGGAAIAPSIACVKWWTVPAAPLTADLRGEVGAGYVETAPQIAARIVAARSALVVSNAAAMAAARPGAAGIHADSEGETAAQLLDRLLLRVSLIWIVDADGTIRLSPIGYDAPVEELVATEIEREATFKPVTEVLLGYQRNHRRHSDAEISAAFQASDGTYADGTPIEDLKPAESGATNSGNPNSPFGSRTVGAFIDTVDGKTTTFFRVTAPSAAESQENDLWINTALGNRVFRRLPGSGFLAIGNDRIVLSGGAIELCWAEAPDQRIGQALIDAAGARATADGKVEAFTLLSTFETVPVGSGIGDILYRLYLSPPQIDRWSGSEWVPQATYGATADQATSITQSQIAIASIVSDAILSRGEKPAFIREWKRAQADATALLGKAAGFAGVDAEKAALTAARAALELAINALAPAYTDTNADSPIADPAALQTKWNTFFATYAALLVAITAQTLVVQWSVNGATGWHTDYAAGDLYQRQSTDGGATWGTPFKAVGEDGTGTPGQDGKFTSFVFKRSAAAPATPTGAATPPAGWFDAPPAQTIPATALWQSSADFRGADRLTDWAAPKKLVPADLADLDPGAKDLLDQAKSIADGKNKQFYRDTPPRAAESQEGDTWFNTALGNRAYRRVAGTGLLAIGGNRVILGGGGIELCWVEAPDQRIAMVVQDVAHTLGIAEEADAKADAAIDSLLGLGDDSKLDPSEKIRVLIPKNAELQSAWAILDAQAGDFGITTQRAAAAAARAAWASYRDGLSPAWDATGAETAIVRPTFRAKLGDYEAAIELLKRAISAEAARRAHWSAVVDDNGQLPEPGADVTANKQVSIVPPAQAIVTADYQGTFTAGQFPKVLTPQVARGGSSIRTTNETSYALASISAGGTGAVTVNNTNGSADKGRITITDAMTASFTFTLIITINGVIQAPIPLAVIVERAPPPTGGGGSGGGTGNKTGSDSNFPWLDTTSYVEWSDVFTVDVASGETLRCYAALDYQYQGAAGTGNYTFGVWRYRASPGGTWTDIASAVSGSNSGVPSDPGGGFPNLPTPIDPDDPPADPYPGGIICNQNKVGLSPGLYDVALFARLGTAGGGIGVIGGTASVNVSA